MTGPTAIASPGARTDAFELTVPSDRARAFAEAANDTSEVYQRGELAHPVFGLIVSGHAIIELYKMLFPEWPHVDIIHLSSDTHFFEPLIPETEVLAQAALIGAAPSARGPLWHLVSSLVHSNGAPIVESYATILLPGREVEPEWGRTPPDVHVPELRRAPTLDRKVVVIDDDQPARYAEASGDDQAIHFDDDAARAAGLPRRVLHGGCTMAMCATAAVDLAAGGDPRRIARLAMRFNRPVHPGSELVMEITQPRITNGRACHGIRVECGGRPVVRGGRADFTP
jgi:acyl dehydratase